MLVQRCSFKAPEVCEKAKDLKNGVCFNCTQHPLLSAASMKYITWEESGQETILGLATKKFWLKQDVDKPEYIGG
jgi:hypothetical protein